MLFGLLWKSGKIYSFVLIKPVKSQISSIINWLVVYWKNQVYLFFQPTFVYTFLVCTYISIINET